MKVKMTGKEYVTKLEARGVYGPHAEMAKLLACEAGLEFAPEPVALPEKLKLSPDGKLLPDFPGEEWRGADYPGELLDAIHQEALARYHAYPPLRSAAARLVDLISPQVRIEGVEFAVVQDMRTALADIRIALAKGPKS